MEVCPEVREKIVDSVERIKKAARFAPVQVLWSPPANYHVTLFFLGNIPSPEAENLRKLVQNERPLIPPFKLDFRHFSTFPDAPRKSPKVLWAGVHNPPDALRQLRLHAGGLLAKASLPVPAQDFHPHVTIARFKATKGMFAFRKLLETYKVQKFGTCIVRRLVLMESITGKGPAHYEPFATAELHNV
ncbi:RNA 2',3'-cyclic phosphodiesterase [Candidatus Sumerlaeota bacterium]|nr:RNA 2',3'-cyclic phosphodiesterase [Candidatus Sumerlaeota bacterium]